MPPWSGGASKDAIIAGNSRSRCKAFTRSSPNPKPSRPIHQTRRSRVSPATHRHPPPPTTTGDCTAVPLTAMLPAKRTAHAAAATRAHAHPGPPPRHPLLRRGGRRRRCRLDATSHTLSGGAAPTNRPGPAASAAKQPPRAPSTTSSTAECHAGRRPRQHDSSGPPGPDRARMAQIWPARPSTRPPASAPKAPSASKPPLPAGRRAQTADGGSSRTGGCRREPQLAGETARQREEKGPAAAAPTGLCPAEATGDGRREGGGGGWPVVAGLRRRPSRPWGERRGGPCGGRPCIVFRIWPTKESPNI
jgi:hypothetical protein